MNPILLSTPFASSGDKNTIPESESSQPQNATWEKGFPPITQTPISEGGIPPERDDFNGVLNAITQNIVFQTQGGRYKFDPTYANKIGGYPVNAVLQLENGAEVINKTPNNTANPNVDMTGWGFANTNKNTSQKLQKAATVNTGLGYSKRLIANIPFKYPDYDKYSKIFKQYNCFPQGFTFDPVDNYIYLAIQSNSVTTIAVWDISDQKKPSFVTIFKLDGVTYTNEGLIIKYESGARNLYFRNNQSRLCKIDITTMPTAGSIIPETSFIDTGVPTSRNFAAWGDNFVLSRVGPPIGSGKDSRSAYSICDKDFKIVNNVSMSGASGGVIEGAPYSDILPKIQGFAACAGGYVASSGGDPAGVSTYTNLGILAWDESGSLMSQNLVPSEAMKKYVESIGETPHYCETEGIYSDTDGRIYTLVLYVNEKNQTGADRGGVMIFEEFSTHSEAVDFSKDATRVPTPQDNYGSGLFPISYFKDINGEYVNAYFNPFTRSSFKSWYEICGYMISCESSSFSYFANSGASAKPLDMLGNEIPNDYGLVTINNYNNNTFVAECLGVDGQIRSFKLVYSLKSQTLVVNKFYSQVHLELETPVIELRRASASGSVIQRGQLQLSDSGNFGLYDNTNNAGWVIMGKPNGTNYIGRDTDVSGKLISKLLRVTQTKVFPDNASAKAGGLIDGDVYRTSTGQLMIVY